MDMTTEGGGAPAIAGVEGRERGADCPICREGAPTGRLSLRGIATLIGQHLRLERGLLHTFTELILRPGPMLRAYFDGQDRRRYVNPVSYLLLSAAATLLAFTLYEDDYRGAVAKQIESRMSGEAAASLGSSEAAAMFMRRYTEAFFEVMQYTSVTTLSMALPFAVLVWLLFRGPRFNLAEALTFALYATGTALLLHSVLITPLLMAGAWNLGSYGGTLFYLAIPVWMGRGLFGRGVANVGRMALAMFGGYAVGMILIQIVVGAIVAYRSIGH